MPADAQDLLPGARLLDRYRIIDRVAGGGMATIHRAVDERFDRIVCVKLLRVQMEGGSTGGSAPDNPVYLHFLREALALSKLQHPNTLRIYDFGYLPEGQRPFQVSEFLDGGNLRQHVRGRGALRADETLGILERITGAITEAHEQKILHRDIKPSNILFARIGEDLMPKLADFGIARTILARRPESGQTPDASHIGMFSPRWAAPEQLRGEPEAPSTDVYAFGLVTAFMLSGLVPFEGDSPRDMEGGAVEHDRALGRRFTEMGIPLEVRRTLMSATLADPLARTATASAFFEELRTAMGAPRMSLPPSRVDSSRGVPPARASAPAPLPVVAEVAPPPPVSTARRGVRVAEVYEKLELEVPSAHGIAAQFRVSFLLERERAFRIQVKGLNCFVAKVTASGVARPTPAINAAEDFSVEFVSTMKHVLGRAVFVFGRLAASGEHVFRTREGDVVVASPSGSFAVAVDLGPRQDLIVICTRS